MRKAAIKIGVSLVGTLIQDEEGYHFSYSENFLNLKNAQPVSLTLPLQSIPFHSKVLFPFFDGLIPEGWLLTIVEKNWKLNHRDRMGLLLATCRDCIGAVSVEEIIDNESHA